MRRLTLLLLPALLGAAETRYARLGEFEGNVEVQLTAADDWTGAVRNLPVLESSWLRTGPASRVEIELDEGSRLRLGANSQGEIADYCRLATGQRITMLALDRGVAYFSGEAEGKDALTLTVPGAQVVISRPAKLRLEVEENWSRISVLEGTVRFSSPAAEIDLRQGQATRVEPANPARFFLDRELTALELDKWSETRDRALAVSPAAGHVIQRYGLTDLDIAGEWIQTEDLGAVWKPKVDEGWVPFRKGRWQWFGALGYTWVSGEDWGWLPYHHGRWQHRENLNWVWVPSKSTVFKPGDVYWLRGAKLAGWGPLAPGEDWNWIGAGSEVPRQFLNAWSTFASFEPDAAAIDASAAIVWPKEPLRVASFVTALPSPAFFASRLEYVRPLVDARRTRITPSVEGVTFVSSTSPTVVVVKPPPAAPPVVLITGPPPADPPAPELVPYPVPVYTGIVMRERQSGSRPPAVAVPAKPAPGPASPTGAAARPAAPSVNPRPGEKRVSGTRREKKFRDTREQHMAAQAIGDVNAGSFGKAVASLDAWSERYPDSEFRYDRLYYYIVALDGTRQPAKVVERARELFSDPNAALEDPRQMLLAAYLSGVNLQKLPHITEKQHAAGVAAARALQQTVPLYFKSENRPSETSDADWAKARNELETTARDTLTWLRAHRGLPD